jgi:hypothetical protein
MPVDIKKILRPLVPKAILDRRQRRTLRSFDHDYAQQPAREAFSAIYRRGLWGRGGTDSFYSGVGSHDPLIVEHYVAAVSRFIESLPRRPSAVDLGCGDFNIGSRVHALCATYVGCDVVPELVDRNRAAFPNVEFRCVDIVSDPLPAGDVAFIRQVLQHLNNAQISQVLEKLRTYRFLVVTEHLPDGNGFVPNLDKPCGLDIRLDRHPISGVVLTEPPFGLVPRSEQVICEERGFGGTIRTTVYEMR